MSNKSKIVFFLTTLLISLSLVFCFMYWSDTYSVVNTKRVKFYNEPNRNVMKVEYILSNSNKYDSFIFGSSRVGGFNPYWFEDGSYYNMSYSEGIPKEHLLNIKLFINSGVKIKNLLIGLDDFSYQVSFEQHQMQGLTKAHYLATDTSKFKFYLDYFLRFPDSIDRKHILNSLKQSQIYFYHDIANQYRADIIYEELPNDDEVIESNFLKPTLYDANYIDSTLEDIRQIVDVCYQYGINCTFFINPIHHVTYKYLDKDKLVDFKIRLSEITQYYDFSLPNEISNNNMYWLETSHYKKNVSFLISNNLKNKSKDSSFGVFVEKYSTIHSNH